MSRKYIIIIAFLSLITLHALALDVRNTAGMLSQNVKDLDVTSLTVTGTINASDLYFISGNLHLLTSLDLSGVEVTSCTTTERHYLQQIFAANELPVACLADMGLTSVKLPSGLLTIGRAAFAGCDKLTEITLPANLDSIADFAFAGCESIKAVTIPAKVETVGCGAFMRCSALTDFTVESSSHLRRLDAAALMDCPSLTNVSLGASIRSLGERSLAGTGLKTLDLSGNKNLAELGDWVMVETPVTKVVLPASVTSLGDGAFLYDKSLASIRLSDKLTTLNDYLLAGTGLTGTLSISGTESMGDYVMYNADKLSVVELPATLTWLGTRAMAGMTGMKALTSNAVEVPALGSNVWTWGIRAYRSTDFYNWEDMGLIIPPDTINPTSPLHYSQTLDRPHILHNPRTSKWVCWIKSMDTDGYFVIMQADGEADMTKVVALNESAMLVYEQLKGKEFAVADVARVLTDEYEVDEATALADAEALVASMRHEHLIID